MWQPNFAQPKMLMKDHADTEYELMMQKQEYNKKMKEFEKAQMLSMGIPDIDDKDNNIVANLETYKARGWDNFKDENEKGEGNRGNN